MSKIRIQLKPAMARVLRDGARHRICLAGRRSGKSYLSVTELLQTAIGKPGSNGIYMAPTLLMSRGIAWELLKRYVPTSWTTNKNEVQMRIVLKNGSSIKCGALDQADSLRGLSADLLVLDEFAYAMNLQESWNAALRPLLSTTRGRSLWISTPSGGDPWVRTFCERVQEGIEGWSFHSYQTLQCGWVDQQELEEARAEMDPALFRQEYCATFESLEGAVYPKFGDDNIRPVEDRGGDVLVGLDFNVSPFCAVIAQASPAGDVEVLRELILQESDTDEMAAALQTLYPNREIKVCPDPTGSRRQTSSLGLSDHAILKRRGLKVFTPSRPYRIADKITTTRWHICDANGQRRLFVDPSCKQLIASLKALQFEEGKSVPSARDKFSHSPDALGYLLLALKTGLVPYTTGVTNFRLY